jgi:pimeloyl-ACP methyl ester carboxylesterase
MPYNLAVLGPNKAIKAVELFPEVENWYIGGHSLGGAMASSCAALNPDLFGGVILLGAYSTNDITDFRVLSIYGTNDLVMNRVKYESNIKHLPKNFEEHVIIGGNHAYFGMYGEQDGDGEAIISNEEQIEITTGYIYRFITK